MKKIITFIITLTIIFSSLSTTFAEEGYIEKLFNLNYQPEEINLNLSKIKFIQFNNEKYNRIYRELKTVNSILKKGFIKNYKNGIYGYYKMNGIIKNYNNFIYYTNEFLFYQKLKEQHNNYGEINTAIIKSSINMRNSYMKFKNIIKN